RGALQIQYEGLWQFGIEGGIDLFPRFGFVFVAIAQGEGQGIAFDEVGYHGLRYRWQLGDEGVDATRELQTAQLQIEMPGNVVQWIEVVDAYGLNDQGLAFLLDMQVAQSESAIEA